MERWVVSFSIIPGSTFSFCSQNFEKNVPSVVKNAFYIKFDHAADVEWEKKEGMYEVEFEINNADYKALIDTSGAIKMYKMEILPQQLPHAVKNAANERFERYKIEEAELVDIDGVIYYQLDLEGRKDKAIIYTAEGQENKAISYWE